MQIWLNVGLLHQIYSHPGQIEIPTDSENCSTILDKLQEDRLLKVKKRSFRLSGGATVSQTPELASSEGSDGFVCSGGRQNFLKEVTNVLSLGNHQNSRVSAIGTGNRA